MEVWYSTPNSDESKTKLANRPIEKEVWSAQATRQPALPDRFISLSLSFDILCLGVGAGAVSLDRRCKEVITTEAATMSSGERPPPSTETSRKQPQFINKKQAHTRRQMKSAAQHATTISGCRHVSHLRLSIRLRVGCDR
jgi:hypothetical protein